MKKLIAITGGIGSGKSAVLKIIANMNYPIISADDVNRRLLEDVEYLRELEDHFPESFVSGVFDKKILASIIFNDEKKRLELNSIAHKHITELIKKRIDNIMSNIIFVEVPLLIESGMKDMFDEVIVVTSDRETKIARVMKRDNFTRDQVIARMNSQLDDSELIDIATHMIENNSTFFDLEKSVKSVVSSL